MTQQQLRNKAAAILEKSKDPVAAAVYLGLTDVAKSIEGLDASLSRLPQFVLGAGNAIAEQLTTINNTTGKFVSQHLGQIADAIETGRS